MPHTSPLRAITRYLGAVADRYLTSSILSPHLRGRMAGFAGHRSGTRSRPGRGADIPSVSPLATRREGGPA